MTNIFRARMVAVALIVAAVSANASAQSDRVYEKSGGNVAGAVAQTSAKGVQLKKRGNANQAFLASDVLKILFEGDPPELTRGREFAIDGQFDQALEELKKIDTGSIKRDVIKADAAFYTAYSQAKLALAGKGAKDVAAKNVLGFISQHRESWHFYDAAKILGDLALALGSTENALKYYGSLSSSPSADTKVESVYLQGLAHVKAKNNDKALEQFEKVIGIPSRTTATARIQILAKAGKAVALAQQDKSGEGLTIVKNLIAELNPADIEMASRIYNAQGASYEASGDDEGAILSYLHTHLMFSSQADAHAEALLRLVELWPKVGKPERAAEARQELLTRYPDAK